MSQKFKGRAVEMVVSSKTIAESLRNNIDELSSVRTSWTPEYADDLHNRIDHIMENRLGIDPKREQRQSTDRVGELEVPALRDLSHLRKQLKVDFNGSELEEIFNTLGYTKHLSKARNHDTESLILLLYSFQAGMTDELKAKITANGTSPALIDRIISYAGQVAEANAQQETLKESSTRLSAEIMQELNDLYDEIIGICKIASSYYHYDPVKKNEFVYSRVLRRLRSSHHASEDQPEPSQE